MLTHELLQSILIDAGFVVNHMYRDSCYRQYVAIDVDYTFIEVYCLHDEIIARYTWNNREIARYRLHDPNCFEKLFTAIRLSATPERARINTPTLCSKNDASLA